MANTNSDTASSTASDVAQEVGAIVARARAAQEAISDWDQERVDELVTAVGWAIVRKDHAESLAQLAVDEGGFGTSSVDLTVLPSRPGKDCQAGWCRRSLDPDDWSGCNPTDEGPHGPQGS